MIAAAERIIDTGGQGGTPVDYLDGVVFSADESYLCVGRRTTTAGPVSDYTGKHIYYQSMQHDITPVERAKDDRLTTHDYFWLWDTDWFWCSRAFGMQNPRLRRWWPRRYRRSSVYSKIVSMDRQFGVSDRVEARNGRPPRERVVQDVEVPIRRACDFLEWFLDNVPITPIWLCPLRLRDHDGWTLYPIRPDQTYVNVGFWSSVPAGDSAGTTNRTIEAKVSELDGHKSLYSDSFYTREEFDELYGGDAYDTVKNSYDPESRLLDLYAKAVQRR
jgi:FAD/FMN-containing dehydrogenase